MTDGKVVKQVAIDIDDAKNLEKAPLSPRIDSNDQLTTPRTAALRNSKKNKSKDITSGDVSVDIGATQTIVREISELDIGGHSKVEKGVALTWKDLTYTVKSGKTILNNLSGYARPGDVIIIMGPSGSGKTSLLSILSGNRFHTSGQIYYQGKEKTVTTSSEDIMGFKGNASYVAQHDELMGSLTVKETLMYASQLKISDNEVDKQQVVDSLIKYLGLEVCEDTPVGTPFQKGISGGQKRRLSIGIELVTQPGLLFLDEVTSGLDATSAFHLLRLIAKLARLGHTIIMTLHQPTSRLFKLMCDFNFYMLILESGNQSYFGYAKDSIDYFASLGYKVPPFTNATDYFLDLVNRDFDKCLQDEKNEGKKDKKDTNNNATNNTANAPNKDCEFTADIINKAFLTKLPLIYNEIEKVNNEFKNAETPVLKPNSFFKQLVILLRKNFINILRNPAIFWMRLSGNVGLSLCLGTLYFNIDNDESATQDRANLMFFITCFYSYMAVAGMPVFVEERAYYIRERMNNHYSTAAYVISNFLGAIPWVAILAVVNSIILYTMVQFRWDWEHYGMFLLNFFVVLMVAENMVVAISAISELFIIGLAVVSGIMGFYMVICGFVIRESNIPDGWIWVHHGVAYHTYGLGTFMYNDFHDNGNVEWEDGGDGNDVLKSFDMEDEDIPFNFLILVIMMIVYRVMFYGFLKLLHRRQG